MYKPADRPDGRNTEFVELYNSNPWPEDIGRYRLEGQILFTFPAGTKIPAQSRIVVAAVPADLQAAYGLSGVFGPYTNTLKTSGALLLRDEQNSVLLDLEYDDSAPWPMGADGSGHSIVLSRASYGEGDARAWERSPLSGGSPGSNDIASLLLPRTVVINEILAHTDPPDIDSIELYNHHTAAVDLSGCTLSDDPVKNKFVIPHGTVIPAGGFLAFNENTLGFSLNAAGETIYFRSAGGLHVIDAVKFGAQENGVSFGRSPDGSAWSRLPATTFGASNPPPLISRVGINEIMYNPISRNDDDQFVEIHNHGTNAVSLAGWKLGGGISFTFPANCTISAGGYLVIARNASRLKLNYPQLHPNNTVGNFSGRLSGSGERITLSMPDLIVDTQAPGNPTTNSIDIVVDEVSYDTGGRWGTWADGGGSSLELIDPRADKRFAANWADSDETSKAPWTTIEFTGRPSSSAGGSIQVGLLGPGECLIDEVEIRSGNDRNIVSNPSFSSASSISFLGSHSRSSIVPSGGYPFGGSALHLRTGDAIAVGPNAVLMGLSGNASSLQNATIRYRARWLRGCPEPLVRFVGCQLGATDRLTIPSNLGTPGLANSQLKTNAGPAIHQVRHDPAVPSVNQAVVVTARVSDPDGVQSLTLNYRNDPSPAFTAVEMNDSGTHGDAIAGDGVFSGTIPGRSKGAVAFVVTTTDHLGATNRFPELRQDHAPVRECVVYFGDPNPTNLFGTYHLWLTQSNVTRWTSLPVMSNEDIDGTLVYNNRIIYNMGGRYSGSPWHQSYDSPAGNRACHYVWSMPKDDRLLGATSFNKIHWPGNDIQQDSSTSNLNDATLQREQAAYLFMRSLGLPWSYRRFVAVYVNGVRRGKLMEDALRPTGGTVKDQYLPDDTGVQLWKMQRWYSGETTSLISECRLTQHTFQNGSYQLERYRPNWSLKETDTSFSDFTNVFRLIDAARAYNDEDYIQILENLVNTENWMRMLAANNAVGNWDAFGASSGQNVDAWVSSQTKWTLFTIDLSICLDNGLASGGLFQTGETPWSRMLNTPRFTRMYLRALKELAEGVMDPAVIHPILDAKHSAFLAAGIVAATPSGTKSSIASRRSDINSRLSPLAGTTFGVADTSLMTSSNSVTISGIAPLEVDSIQINGTNFKPTWTSVTNWTVTAAVSSGSHIWAIEARNRAGAAIGSSFNVTVHNSGTPEMPTDQLVLNEIFFNAPVPGAQFLELFNNATNTTFDLTGWTVNGTGYVFPPGSTIAPGEHLVLARSSIEFAAHFGAMIPVFGTFDGTLQSDGETLSLMQPGNVVIDRVRYESSLPWPGTLPGRSLQLRDPRQDNSRVGNWAVGQGLLSSTPGAANLIPEIMPPFPSVWLNEVQPVNTTGPVDAAGERDPWVEIYNPGFSSVDLTGYYMGTNYAQPNQWSFPPGTVIGPGQFLLVWLDGEIADSTLASPHTPFGPESGSIALSRMFNGQPQIVDYLTFSGTPANQTYGDVPDAQPFYRNFMFHVTPGATNNPALAPITVTINEWMAENDGSLRNPATGKYDDWFELHNPSDTPADLSGYYLSDSLANRFKFQIPIGFQVPAKGYLLVWADEFTVANTNTSALHASFKLGKDGEAIGLFLPDGTPIDAVVFGAQAANISEARFPDSGALRLFTPSPTPGSRNIPPAAAVAPTVTAMSVQLDSSCLIRFATSPGHFYRVEYKDELGDPEWSSLGEERFAAGDSLSFTDSTAGANRFYRIVLVSMW